jgi:hypothetical protein
MGRHSSPRCSRGGRRRAYLPVGAEELLELGWRARCSRASCRSRHDRRRPQLHGQEGRRPGAGADRRVPELGRTFRIRAFRTAARAVGGFSRPGDGIDDGSPAATRRGPATLQMSPRSSPPAGRACQELREQIPPGLVEMLAIQGPASPRSARSTTLDIDSLPELEAGSHGRAGASPRFGPKTSGEHPRASPTCGGERLPALAPRGGRGEGLRAALERMPGVVVVAGDAAAPRWYGIWCWGSWRMSHRASCQAAEPAAGRARARGPDDRRLTLRCGRGQRADRGDDPGEQGGCWRHPSDAHCGARARGLCAISP